MKFLYPLLAIPLFIIVFTIAAYPSSSFLDPSYKKTLTTVFWVGEASTPQNDFIPNDKSAWDSSWQNRFGGIDDPENRCGYNPCAFTPKENPFYFALPYNDLDDQGNRKNSAGQIPWFEEKNDHQSVLKNSWLTITYHDQTCYAQWQDVGPNETDDFDYVFGEAPPSNTFGISAGLDISPAVRDCLKMTTNDNVYWKFITDSEVPPGPWQKTITTSEVSW